MVLPSEGLVTDVTRIRPLVSVCPLVNQQVVGFGKVASTELADELFLGLGRVSASVGLALRRRHPGHVQQSSRSLRCVSRSRCAQVLGLQRIVLRGRGCQVGKVKAGLVLRAVFGQQDVRQDGDGGHRRQLARQFGEAAARYNQSRAVKGELMEVDGVKSAEAVEAVEMIGWQLEASGALEQGVVGQLDGWVERDRCRESPAAHGFLGHTEHYDINAVNPPHTTQEDGAR